MTDDQHIRINKWLAYLGVASRREADRWIREGRVGINGQPIRELGLRIDPEADQITVDGRLVSDRIPPRVYWLLHKPDACLTTRASEDGKPTIYDLPRLRSLPFLASPVGRLDFRTEGLLLITNDGELANRLCMPTYEIPRGYYALVNKRLRSEEAQKIRSGVELADGICKPVKLQLVTSRSLGASRGVWYELEVREGRNRLVRRLFEMFDVKVIRLIRFSFGCLRLPESLKPGDYLQLSSAQITELKRDTDLAEQLSR